MHPVIGVEFGHDAVQLGRLFLWIAGIRKNDIDQQIALVQGRPAGNGQVAIHAEVDGHGISGDAVAGEALNHGRKCPRVAVITGNEYRGDICLPDGQVANGVELALPPHGAADCHGAEDTSGPTDHSRPSAMRFLVMGRSLLSVPIVRCWAAWRYSGAYSTSIFIHNQYSKLINLV